MIAIQTSPRNGKVVAVRLVGCVEIVGGAVPPLPATTVSVRFLVTVRLARPLSDAVSSTVNTPSWVGVPVILPVVAL